MIKILIRLILFFLSEFGYFLALDRKTKINRAFVPMVTVASQVCILFIGGILNLLRPVSILLYLTGFISLIWFVFTQKEIRFIKEFAFDKSIFLLYFMLVLCVLALHGKLFVFHDNFSHWALITKQMLLTDRFPNFQDIVIEYQDYPPGSACFIYYLSSFVSQKEWIQMIAQAFMMLSFAISIFSCCNKTKTY